MIRKSQNIKRSDTVVKSSTSSQPFIDFAELLALVTSKFQGLLVSRAVDEPSTTYEESANAESNTVCADLETTTPTLTAAQPSGFMRLPLELREKVYDHLLSELPTEIKLKHNDENPPLSYLPRGTLPPLAYTNYGMFEEICLRYLRRTKLTLIDMSRAKSTGFRRFVEHFGNDGAFKSIRALEYNRSVIFPKDFAQYRTIRDSEVIMRCTRLESLVLHISAFSLAHRHPPFHPKNANGWQIGRHIRLKTPEEVDAGHHTSRIFKHTGSFKLRLVIEHVTIAARENGLTCEEYLDGYVQGMEAFREQHGSKIEVQVVHKCVWCTAMKGKYMWVD